MDRLAVSVETHGMHVFARIDHAAAAAGVGLTLAPTEVLLFGNPKVGTRLMQDTQTLGIELPLKVLVWQDQTGRTWVSYSDLKVVVARHGGASPSIGSILDTMASGMETVVREAAGTVGDSATRIR